MSDDPEYDEVAGGAIERVEAEPPAEVPQEEGRATATALKLKLGSRGVMFTNVDEAVKYATACHRSGLLPSHIKSPAQAFVIMDNGRALGLGSWAAWKLIYITRQGRIAIMSKGALAVAQASPRFENYDESIEFEGSDQMQAKAVAKARGHREVVKTFTMADARLAGLLVRPVNKRGEEYDGPWQAYLKDMLLARARDRALAIAFAAELAGIELETIAADADRLERGAAGAVEVVGTPAAAASEAPPPKALAEASRDPLVAMLKGKAPEAQKPTPVVVGAPELTPEMADAMKRRNADIAKSVDEALPPPKEGKKGRKRYKVGDTYMGTRRVTEVDEDGRIVEAVKIERGDSSAEEQRALNAQVAGSTPAPPAKSDPTKPPFPAHKAEDGSWYCDAHNAYGCPVCANPEGKPKRCPREHCGAPLNMFGDCDACGFPRARFE